MNLNVSMFDHTYYREWVVFDLLPRLQPWDSTRGGHPGDATPGGNFPPGGTPVRGTLVWPRMGSDVFALAGRVDALTGTVW